MKTTDRWRIALFAVTIAAIGFNIWFFRPPDPVAERPTKVGDIPDPIPPEGYCMNQRFKNVKLNPDKTIQQMRDFYKRMNIYKSRHGIMPTSYGMIRGDIKQNPSLYGYKDFKEAVLSNYNADVYVSDSHFTEDTKTIIQAYRVCELRPDGTKIGSPHALGTRDVLAFSNIYHFGDVCLFPNGKSTGNPTGFYLLLWEDGEVSRVPFDQVRYVYPQIEGAGAECFPGQTGVPTTTYTASEWSLKIKSLRPDGTNPNVIPASK